MKKAHETCPICGGEMSAIKNINSPCFFLKEKHRRLSYITNSCIAYNDFMVKRDHDFYQIQSLYGDLYVERFLDRENSTGIIINYIEANSKILYTISNHVEDIVAEYNKIIDMDYPDLIKIKHKLKTMVIFS